MIRRKSDIGQIIENFEEYSNYDGKKYYFSFQTENPNGTVTLMKYEDGTFTYHRKNELYWDIKEIKVDTGVLTDIIWGFRKVINQNLKAIAS